MRCVFVIILSLPGPARLSDPEGRSGSGLGLLLRPPDLEDDESANEAKIAWKAWMKVYRVMCSMCLIGGKPLIAKVAQIVLATPASEAICERLFERAKHMGTTDRMARFLDETIEMPVIQVAQHNIARH